MKWLVLVTHGRRVGIHLTSRGVREMRDMAALLRSRPDLDLEGWIVEEEVKLFASTAHYVMESAAVLGEHLGIPGPSGWEELWQDWEHEADLDRAIRLIELSTYDVVIAVTHQQLVADLFRHYAGELWISCSDYHPGYGEAVIVNMAEAGIRDNPLQVLRRDSVAA